MSKIKQFFMPMLVLVFVLSLGLSMSAVEKSELKVIADANISAGGLYLQPRVYYSQATLTISGPDGYVFSKTFDSGSSLYQGLSDDQGAMLRDGSYTYELTVIQSASKLVRGESGNEAGLERNNGQKQQPLVQSGYFTVRGGSMVTARSEGTPGFRQGIQDEGNVADDQVILDDLIVDGSICVGQDCTSGESFGFDTIRLKENNLRIKFQDTSSSSSFPSNDWQITANDSANGGANKFSIDDIDGGRTPFTIEAASPTNSLYVDSSGRIGLGTATPTVEVHVVDGDSPTLRLEQDGSSGFTPQTWDVAGNESNFFVRDVTNGSQLPFKIRPGADGDSLVLEANSDVSLGGTGAGAIVTVDDSEKSVGINNNAPEAVFHVLTDSPNVGMFESSGTEGWFLLDNSGSSDYNSVAVGSQNDDLRLRAGDAERIRIDSNGNVGFGVFSGLTHPIQAASGAHLTTGGTWTNSSSRELKENIMNLTTIEAFDTLSGLSPVKYNYKNEKDEPCVGFIAEDVPELVAQKDRKSLSPMDVVAVLTKVVQEQQDTIKATQDQVKELQKQIEALQKDRK